jgi:hypothetical protein
MNSHSCLHKKGVSKFLGVVYLKCDPAERHGHRDDQCIVESPVHLQLRRHPSRLQKNGFTIRNSVGITEET